MQFTIAAATTRADLPVVLQLVRELARFERLEHEVEATVEGMEEDFFGGRPIAGALLAKAGEEVAGFALYFFTFSTFVGRRGIWLEDLYVRPAFRKHGIGKALIKGVARIGVERNCGRFEWTALKWNDTALEIYQKLGARRMDDWVTLRLDSAGLRNLAR